MTKLIQIQLFGNKMKWPNKFKRYRQLQETTIHCNDDDEDNDKSKGKGKQQKDDFLQNSFSLLLLIPLMKIIMI